MGTVSDKEALELWGASDGGNTVSDKEALKAWDGAAGEPGQPGHEQYGNDPMARVDSTPVTPKGEPIDFMKSFADKAALGAGPQIAGAIGALANSATQGFTDKPTSDLDAYRSVRDDTERELDASERTGYGQLATLPAMIATPVPFKGLGKLASPVAKAKQAATIGAGVGGLSALANSNADLTKPSYEGFKRAFLDATLGAGLGAAGGGTTGALLGGAQPKLTAAAEEQALRAAGLQAGIKNSLKTDLGLNNMTEARALGRRFLDEDLIPLVGSSEAVADRAQRLEGEAAQSIGATMNRADVATMSAPPLAAGQTSAGRPSNVPKPSPGFDFEAMSDAARRVTEEASAPADLMSGAKARDLADAFKAQAERTPGSFVGANKAKSDAWKSARFDQDAPMSAQLYRKAVGAARDDIARQVADALGPEEAASLGAANERYGVAADALKLAQNESQRRAARKGVTLGDVLALTTGGTAGGFSGHPGLGVGGGAALALGLKGFDKYGHSSAARFADFLAERAANNSGGVVGARGANALADYAGLLEDPNEPISLPPDWLEFAKEKKR